MIATETSLEQPLREPARAQEVRRIWGLAPCDLYDRYWAARGVQVVRPGTPVQARGPVLYLLVGGSECLFFDLALLVRRLNALKPRAVRLRIGDDRQQPYRETVLSDLDDRFVAIHRHYRSTGHSAARAWLTPDRAIAERWAASCAPADGARQVKLMAGARLLSLSTKGQVLNPGDPQDLAECLKLIQLRWRNPGVALDGVFEFQPGVWIHEQARVPVGVRFAGTVWVGAATRLAAGDILVGPVILDDGEHAEAYPSPIDWDAARLSHYRLVPRFRRSSLDLAAKRAFDILFSLSVLMATAPLYPLVMLAIWAEDGWPVFFAHTRQTIGGRPFPCYKFRTMCRNAEQLKAQLVTSNACDGPQFFIERDPRVLRIGRILRRTQLDELPQFWNVLLGHMSVVGPRPSPDKENQFCPTWREARLSIRPGITGLWQVSRTREPETDFQEWIRYDLDYVQHASWHLDLWIIIQTIKRLLLGR